MKPIFMIGRGLPFLPQLSGSNSDSTIIELMLTLFDFLNRLSLCVEISSEKLKSNLSLLSSELEALVYKLKLKEDMIYFSFLFLICWKIIKAESSKAKVTLNWRWKLAHKLITSLWTQNLSNNKNRVIMKARQLI